MNEQLKNKWIYYLGGLVVLCVIIFEAQRKGDFYIFISASRDLLEGKNIYQTRYNEWYHYYYDIIFILLLVPFTYFPSNVVVFIWLILNVYFIYRIWKILTSWLPVSLLSNKHRILFSVLSFIFILRFLRDNFHLAQVTIFILYLTIEGLFFIYNNKRIKGSILLALGINIKILPIVFLPYLIYRKEWKSILYIIGFIIMFLLLPALFIGNEFNMFLLKERWHLINPTNQAHVLDTSERSFHSLTTLLATLLIKDCGDTFALPLKRNIADISIENLNIVINVVRGILIVFTLYFLNTKLFKKVKSGLQLLYEVSYLCLIIPLIFPHQQHYAFFFIFPASAYIMFYLIYFFFQNDTNKYTRNFKLRKYTLISMMSIVYLLTSSHFILGVFNNYYDHYKTITYGALILMVLLALCKPEKLVNVIKETHNQV